ncbi:MAG TPA: putative lipid II flippase FtsW [Kiritimatiellia bacterium]|nr:putative lipid II flippase FtsW [Kiritimatiellia bacterium]HMP32855.1 putative lipid II flippase FtsW [Kiritimatiellia bacterium]
MRKSSTALLAIALMLTTLGVVILFSTSSSHFYRQAGFVAVAIALCVLVIRVPYQKWRPLALLVGLGAVILLIMTAIPGVGIEINGSRRWLKFGPVNIQPSEIAKFALILLMARWLSDNQRYIKSIKQGVVIPGVIILVFAFLIMLQPDYGTTVLLGAIGVAMMFAGGTRFGYLLILAAAGAGAIAYKVTKNPVRMRRILAFLHPEEYADTEGFQLLQAIYAFVIGGFGGVGLGDSLQKKSYLPEAHTDFILAILGEELGFLASFTVISLFAAFFSIGLLVSYKLEDMYARLLAFGLTMMISVQAAINIGVVTGCLPTKGLPLPFISYGGTSIVMTMVMVGVLVNVAYQGNQDSPHSRRNSRRDVEA